MIYCVLSATLGVEFLVVTSLIPLGKYFIADSFELQSLKLDAFH